MTPVIWRQSGPEDAEALAYLGAATFLASFAFDHPGKPLIAHLNAEHSVAYYSAKLANPDVDIVIGETPLGAPVGYVMMVPPEHPELQQAGDIELKRIYLLGPWQGGGDGRALLDEALKIAQERRAKRVLLAVYESNARAIAFYERAGFVHVGETTFMVGDTPFRDMVYAKTVAV
jgi:ribosomal protein S18 acetylase RimI-like enzyme